jgi:hypothetical protein
VVLRIILKFFREFGLCSLAMFELVCSTGRGSDKIAKVWHERVIEKGYEDVGAKTRCRTAEGIVSGDDNWSIGLKRIKFVHPCCRLGVLISKYVRNLGLLVFADTRSCSTGEAVTHRIMQ